MILSHGVLYHIISPFLCVAISFGNYGRMHISAPLSACPWLLALTSFQQGFHLLQFLSCTMCSLAIKCAVLQDLMNQELHNAHFSLLAGKLAAPWSLPGSWDAAATWAHLRLCSLTCLTPVMLLPALPCQNSDSMWLTRRDCQCFRPMPFRAFASSWHARTLVLSSRLGCTAAAMEFHLGEW